MSVKILMPSLSPTMTEGNLTKWLVKEGDLIKAGDVIAEIETDKAVMEVEAVDEGIVTKLIPQFGCAIINLGQGNVPMGIRCEVRRNGKLIGNIVVGRVEANRAICKVRKHDMTTPLMVGDTVTVANTKTAKTR